MKLCLLTINAEGFDLPPYGIWILKAFINKYASVNSINVDVIVSSFNYQTSNETVVDYLNNINCDVIGFSMYIWNHIQIKELIHELKSKQQFFNTKLVLGGPHVSFDNKELKELVENNILDALVVGEGEKPLLHILKCLSMNQNITAYKGVYTLYKEHPELSSDLIIYDDNENINYLPNPYIELPELMDESLEKESIQYETSRGCPFNCTFCDQGHKPYKSITMERIESDLKFFADKNTKHTSFLDGTFNLSNKRTIKLLNLLTTYSRSWTFHAEIKPENLKLEEIQLMAQANCLSVELGLQSAHEKTLRLIKRRNNWSKIEQNVKYLIDYNIEVNVNTIIGLPEESLNDWYETLDYCFNLGNVKILSNVLKILPNTVMAEQIKQFGFDFDSTNYTIRKTNTFKKEEIEIATVINRLVDLFWNRTGTPSIIRTITKELFNGRFSLFLEELFYFLLKKPTLLEQQSYFYDSIYSFTQSLGIQTELKKIINNQLEKDYSLARGL
ncbi:B12-binding domain-containing radical SAM protein [Paenibacillus sp. 8b26]|uniref:B12-binding domain-containing radical SAM protein n=1 Tax=Paenibacillus sp. 8b26 TaxID=3424133 RepID=UPI003D6488E9